MSATTAAVASATTATSVMIGLPPLSALMAGIAGAALYQSFATPVGGIRTIMQALMCAIVGCILSPYVGSLLNVHDQLSTASVTAALSFLLNLLTPVLIAHAPDFIKSWLTRGSK